MFIFLFQLEGSDIYFLQAVYQVQGQRTVHAAVLPVQDIQVQQEHLRAGHRHPDEAKRAQLKSDEAQSM